jgi:uncharacterized protein YjbJ (UPF0337 family)
MAAKACLVGSFGRRSRVDGLVIADRPQRMTQGSGTWTKIRIKGSAEQAKGKVKEVAGKLTGDTKLETEGRPTKAAGKIQECHRRT